MIIVLSIHFFSLILEFMATVGIVYSDAYRKETCMSPKFSNRYAIVMELINAYGLIENVRRIPPLLWNNSDLIYKELSVFHASDYLDALIKMDEYFAEDSEPQFSPEDEELFDSYGLSYDCPGFPSLFTHALAAVRGSLAAADALLQRHCKVAINWAGGWHHAKRSEAAGFCYLNDIVLAIHRLLAGLSHPIDASPGSSSLPHASPPDKPAQSTGRVLYIDLDLHHGDGVEEAFWYSPRVVTFSVHHASPGFYPGTGTWSSDLGTGSERVFRSGAGRGRFAAFNLPLAEGADDETWFSAVSPVLALLRQAVAPSYLVVQCGADGLASDPHRVFNLTLSTGDNGSAGGAGGGGGYLLAVKQILSWGLPTLLLGGGGYQWPDTARLWTLLTAAAVEVVQGVSTLLVSDIPDHCYLNLFGPDFQLEVTSLPKLTNREEQRRAIAEHHSRLLEQAVSFGELNGLTTSCDRGLLAEVMQRAMKEEEDISAPSP